MMYGYRGWQGGKERTNAGICNFGCQLWRLFDHRSIGVTVEPRDRWRKGHKLEHRIMISILSHSLIEGLLEAGK